MGVLGETGCPQEAHESAVTLQLHGSEMESIAALQEGCNDSIALCFDCDTIQVRRLSRS